MNDNRSPELHELFKAMSLAQAEMKVAGKDSANPFFKSSYANLQSIIEASRPSLCKHGLSVMQQIVPQDGQDYLVTVLAHNSGQWISSQMKISPVKNDVQSLGSYITYLRRYCYAALVGVYDGTEDDDGNQATYATQQQVDIIRSYGAELCNKILSHYNIRDLSLLKSQDAEIVIARQHKK
ncbi:ERF family protein [Methylobacter sp.]|uniref:ERF family protein n=1 Tax=Methylobacter sp. TaxID=2051955 RepID=UPI003DA49629